MGGSLVWGRVWRQGGSVLVNILASAKPAKAGKFQFPRAKCQRTAGGRRKILQSGNARVEEQASFARSHLPSSMHHRLFREKGKGRAKEGQGEASREKRARAGAMPGQELGGSAW